MKVYFAGAENKQWTKVLADNKVENRFFSYYYTRNQKDNIALTRCFATTKTLIVDSGAHTFFSESDHSLTASVHRKRTKTIETPDVYFERYLEWLIFNKHNFSYFVELDIGELVGQKTVLAWRKKLVENGLFDKCITVCHPAVTDFKTYLRELDESASQYVAIEGLRPNKKQIPYGQYVMAAYKKQIKIHGFALTNQAIVSRYPFYSVDSTSWLSPGKFGTVQYFERGKIKSVAQKDKRKLATKTMTSAALYDTTVSRVEQSYELLNNSIAAFKQFEDYYTRLWTKRGITWKD